MLDSGSNLNYGTPQLNTSYVNEMYGTPITVRNVGTVPCQLTVLGTDATNGMGGYWNLYDYPGMNQFVWNINGNMYNVNIKDSMWGAQTIANNLYPGSSAQYSTYLDMPNSSSSYGTYSFSADIYATSP